MGVGGLFSNRWSSANFVGDTSRHCTERSLWLGHLHTHTLYEKAGPMTFL